MNSDNNTTVSDGAPPPDQYADGVAAALPDFYCRMPAYKQWLSSVIGGRGYKTVLDAAFGNGVDSIQLLEEGYTFVSTDASEPMLAQARNERRRRQNDAAFNNWAIEKANWLNLPQDLRRIDGLPKAGLDVVLCLGNSISMLPDFEGTKHNQKLTLFNLFAMVKPGGILALDHRNYDVILDTGSAPIQDVYYKDMTDYFASTDISVMHANGQPVWITVNNTLRQSAVNNDSAEKETGKATGKGLQGFAVSCYPHRLADICNLIKDVLGDDAKHTVYGDFKPVGEVQIPSHFAHVIEKSASSSQ